MVERRVGSFVELDERVVTKVDSMQTGEGEQLLVAQRADLVVLHIEDVQVLVQIDDQDWRYFGELVRTQVQIAELFKSTCGLRQPF